jgi:hypothetical protein
MINGMKYEDRLVCFVDILGFKSAIDQSVSRDDVRDALHRIIHDLKSSELLNFVYGQIPVFMLDEKNTMRRARDLSNSDLMGALSKSWPVTITQFSDSFVLSCPAHNVASCRLLLKCIYFIHLMYYSNLGMMMRGAIDLGELIHEEGGALFGPAMNSAYSLESKLAIYPRVIVSPKAYAHLKAKLIGDSILDPLKRAFDGHQVFDLISIFSWPECNVPKDEQVDSRLKEIENDVISNAPTAHPKICYLLDQWDLFKSQRNKGVN